MQPETLMALIRALIAVGAVYVCWTALTALRFDKFVREPGSMQAKLLHLVLAVVLGRQFAGFLIDYLEWTAFRW